MEWILLIIYHQSLVSSGPTAHAQTTKRTTPQLTRDIFEYAYHFYRYDPTFVSMKLIQLIDLWNNEEKIILNLSFRFYGMLLTFLGLAWFYLCGMGISAHWMHCKTVFNFFITFKRSQTRWPLIGLRILNPIGQWVESRFIKWFLYVKLTSVPHKDLNITH